MKLVISAECNQTTNGTGLRVVHDGIHQILMIAFAQLHHGEHTVLPDMTNVLCSVIDCSVYKLMFVRYRPSVYELL